MLPLDDEGVAYALVALRNISRKSESANFFQENPGDFFDFKKLTLSLATPKIPRSRKLKKYLVFFSLIRIFAPEDLFICGLPQ